MKTKHKAFADEYNRYMETVYPEEIGWEQRKQLYMAFHAGAVATFSLIANICSEDITNEQMGDRIKLIREEVLARTEDYTQQRDTGN